MPKGSTFAKKYDFRQKVKPFGETLILDKQKNEWQSIPKISSVNPNVDKSIDEILEKCIAYNPQQRLKDGGKIAWLLKNATKKKL